MTSAIRRVEAGVTYVDNGERFTATKSGLMFPARLVLSPEELAAVLVECGYKPPKKDKARG